MYKSIERLQLESMVNRFGYAGVLFMLTEMALDKDEDIAEQIEKCISPIHKIMNAKQGHSL